MDSQNKKQTRTKQFLRNQAAQGDLMFGYDHSQGRIAVIKKNSPLFNGLHNDPYHTVNGDAASLIMNWLSGHQDQPNSHNPNYLLSAISPEIFSGNTFHPKQNLYVDSFNSPYQWDEGETRAYEQLADALLPNGQWHRNYSTLVLSSNASSEQIKIAHQMMSLTGKGLLIIQDKKTSPAINQLINHIIPSQYKEKPLHHDPAILKPSTKSGIAIYAYRHKHPPANLQSAFLTTLPHLQGSQHHLPTQQTQTDWVYDMKVTIPQTGTLTFALDTSKIHSDMEFTAGDQKIIVKKGDPTATIRLDNVKQGESYFLRISTTTDGEPPRFRLGWALPDTRQLSLIPEYAFSHNPEFEEPEPQKETIFTEWMPFEDVIATKPLTQNLHQIITLPPVAINQLRLTEQLAAEAQYFSIEIKGKDREVMLKLDDIALSSHSSWGTLSKEIENTINHQLEPLSHSISVEYRDNTMLLKGDDLVFTQFQLKKSQQIPYTELLKYVHVNKQQETVYQISFTPEQLNYLTHLTFQLQDLDGHHLDIHQAEFKSPTTQFASPDEFAKYLQRVLHHYSQDTSLRVNWNDNKLAITDPHNRQLEKLSFGYQEQILPFIIAENPTETPNQLTVGAVTGTLPQHPDIRYYQLIENAKSGKVTLNHYTGEWQYQPNSDTPFPGFDQFDFIAVMHDGSQSTPISVQLQTEKAPVRSIPGKRTFHMPDPIYHEPILHHHPFPRDMQVHDISLAQTHLQHLDSPYLNLIADRWALIKVNITSQNNELSPNIIAIVRDHQGHELGSVRLTGPQRLPQQLDLLPVQPSVSRQIADKNSFTAPLKGAWVQPGIQVQLMANNHPIVLPYTDQNGCFSPQVNPANHLVARVKNSSLYQTGQGIYAYSPLNWGIEAAAKLPVSQFTLYNSPSETQSPALFYYNHPNFTHSVLTMPQYDKHNPLYNFSDMQIAWAYQQGEMIKQANKEENSLSYMAVTPSNYGSLLGISSFIFFGGGLAKTDILWHEWGHSLGLRHTTNDSYPFTSNSNGFEIAFDQSLQRYVTYKYSNPQDGSTQETHPAMYPVTGQQNKPKYDAVIPHSSYYNNKIQGVLSYTRTSTQLQKDVPVYEVNGSVIQRANSKNHDYSYISPKQTIGLLSDTQQSTTTFYSLKATYATVYGLATYTYYIENKELTDFEAPELFSLNIPDKGELVKLQLMKTDSQQVVHTYTNPDSLANRLFNQYDEKLPLKQLTFDHYWQGSKLFWSSNNADLVDITTGRVNTQLLAPDSTLCAIWVKNGQRQKQYFSLNDPWGNNELISTRRPYVAINHLNQQENTDITPRTSKIESNVALASKAYINQSIDISAMEIPNDPHHYWLTLLVKTGSGKIQEQIPLEEWQIYRQGKQLSVVGSIDSTPDLNIQGLKIYIDKHLQDSVLPNTVTICQQRKSANNSSQFLNYNQQNQFDVIKQASAGMQADEAQSSYANPPHLVIESQAITAPLHRA